MTDRLIIRIIIDNNKLWYVNTWSTEYNNKDQPIPLVRNAAIKSHQVNMGFAEVTHERAESDKSKRAPDENGVNIPDDSNLKDKTVSDRLSALLLCYTTAFCTCSCFTENFLQKFKV